MINSMFILYRKCATICQNYLRLNPDCNSMCAAALRVEKIFEVEVNTFIQTLTFRDAGLTASFIQHMVLCWFPLRSVAWRRLLSLCSQRKTFTAEGTSLLAFAHSTLFSMKASNELRQNKCQIPNPLRWQTT